MQQLPSPTPPTPNPTHPRQVAAEAAADIQRLQTEVLTENNVKALRESVQTLTKTLQHIERITGGGHYCYHFAVVIEFILS